jgi:hypothetical protein
MTELVIIGTVGSTILVATVGEKMLYKKGKHAEAETIQSAMKALLGGFTFTSFIWFAWKLVNMFILGV